MSSVFGSEPVPAPNLVEWQPPLAPLSIRFTGQFSMRSLCQVPPVIGIGQQGRMELSPRLPLNATNLTPAWIQTPSSAQPN